jgi:hypothetical protein
VTVDAIGAPQSYLDASSFFFIPAAAGGHRIVHIDQLAAESGRMV